MTSLPVTFAAAALLALVPGGAAWAQATNNTISILQEGTGNTLRVDQSRATGSTVGGLTVGALGSATGLSLDAGGNQVFRSVTVGGKTKREEVSGSAASRSVSFDPSNPGNALQSGAGNTADLTIAGTGGDVGLLQQNQLGQAGNRATVNLIGDSTALIGQLGAANVAQLTASGQGTLGTIVQEGNGNGANLVVNGDGRSGSIRQIGDGNVSSLDVSSFGGATNVDLIVQGNNLVTPSAGVSVVTNAASVTITQTSLAP